MLRTRSIRNGMKKAETFIDYKIKHFFRNRQNIMRQNPKSCKILPCSRLMLYLCYGTTIHCPYAAFACRNRLSAHKKNIGRRRLHMPQPRRHSLLRRVHLLPQRCLHAIILLGTQEHHPADRRGNGVPHQAPRRGGRLHSLFPVVLQHLCTARPAGGSL